jgi:hypothetical protein
VWTAARGAPPHAARLVLPFRFPPTESVLRRALDFLGAESDIAKISASRYASRATPDEDRAPVPPPDGTGVVVALGSGALPLAQIYGQLSGRAVRKLPANPSAADLKAFATARSLTVAPPSRWSASELSRFLAARRDGAPAVPVGFLYPFGAQRREAFMLKSILFARCFSGGGRYRLLYPVDPQATCMSIAGADVIVGAGAPGSDTAKLLRQPADFLFAAPHANGVNMSLGSVVLCAREDAPLGSRPPARSMPCFFGEPCERERPDNVLLAPSGVRSAIVFLYTCFGVLLDDGVYAPATSLAARFASSAYTAAMITTPGLSLLDRGAGPYVADRIRAGSPLGAVTRDFNREHAGRYGDTPDVAILFGDPELRASAEMQPLTPALREHEAFSAFAAASGLRWYGSDRPEPEGAADPATVDFDRQLRATLEYGRSMVAGTRRVGAAQLKPATDALASALDGVWTAAVMTAARASRATMAHPPPRLRAARERAISHAQLAWLDYFVVLVTTLGGYMRLQTDPFSEPVASGTDGPDCPYCASPTTRLRSTLAGVPGGDRTLLECVSCGTVLDAHEPIDRSQIRCPGHAFAGEPLPLEVDFTISGAPRKSSVSVAVAAVLEPFRKGLDREATVSEAGFDVSGVRTSARQALPALTLPPDTTPGVYFLDCLLLYELAPTIMRRSIVVRSKSLNFLRSQDDRARRSSQPG